MVNRKGPRRGPAGKPRAQALGTVTGPDVRPERAVQAVSAFLGWYPGHPCPQGLRPMLSCATLSGSKLRINLGGGQLACSQGWRPKLSCTTLSGSSASVIGAYFSSVSETSDDPQGSWAATLSLSSPVRTRRCLARENGERVAWHRYLVRFSRRARRWRNASCQRRNCCALSCPERLDSRNRMIASRVSARARSGSFARCS